MLRGQLLPITHQHESPLLKVDGLGRIPIYDAMPRIKAGRLQSVLDDYTLKVIEVYGAFPPGAAKAKKLRLLIGFLSQCFTQQQASLVIQ